MRRDGETLLLGMGCVGRRNVWGVLEMCLRGRNVCCVLEGEMCPKGGGCEGT